MARTGVSSAANPRCCPRASNYGAPRGKAFFFRADFTPWSWLPARFSPGSTAANLVAVRGYRLPPGPSRLPRPASPTTLDSSDPWNVRRPHRAERALKLGPRKT